MAVTPELFRFNETLMDAVRGEGDTEMANEIERRLEQWLANPTPEGITADTAEFDDLSVDGEITVEDSTVTKQSRWYYDSPSSSFILSAENSTSWNIDATGGWVYLSTSGTARRTIKTTEESFTLPQRGADGSTASPTYSWDSNEDTGFFYQGTTGGHGQPQIGVSIDSTLAMTFSKWTSADTDIDGLLGGSAFGGLIGATESGNLTFALRENGGTDAFSFISGGGNFTSDTTYDTVICEMRADGIVYFPNLGTTGSAANAFLNSSSGQFVRSTSTRRSKTNILPYTDTSWVLGLVPVSYTHRGDGKDYIGFIAEEVDAMESRAAERDDDGTVVNYDLRAVVAALVGEVSRIAATLPV